MDFLTFLGSAGAGILNTVCPGMGTAAAGMVNQFLDDEDKIDPGTATASDITTAMSKLPAAEQALMYSYKVDLEKSVISADVAESTNYYNNQKILAELEQNGSNVRPIAVYISLFSMAFAVIGAMCIHFVPVVYWASACFGSATEVLGSEGAVEIATSVAKSALLNATTCNISAMPTPSAVDMVAILALPTWIIQTYMGNREKEKAQRQNAMLGKTTEATPGIMAAITSKLLK